MRLCIPLRTSVEESFVFNNDSLNSTIYISEVASLMRQTLDNSSKQTITIEDEIAYLETYIKLENLHFENRIQKNLQTYISITPSFIESKKITKYSKKKDIEFFNKIEKVYTFNVF